MENRLGRRGGSLRKSRRSSTDSPQIPERDRRLIEDFLAELRKIPEVRAVVLFGSFARRDVDRRSDIDLLVIVDGEDPGALRPRVAELISEMKPHREINPLLTNLRDLDPSFLKTVFAEGTVMYGKLLLSPDHLALEPRVLIAYDLSGIGPTHKVHISRLIHGYKSRKRVAGKTRVYAYPGLNERFDATVVSRSAVLVTQEEAGALVAELEARRIPFSRWDIYLSVP